jgi:site-specific DNA-methyltransferase (adenine-specific)
VPQASPSTPRPKARDQAAKTAGTNGRYVQDSKTVKAASPELHEKVKSGAVTLPQAKRQVEREKKRREQEEKARAASRRSGGGRRSWEIVYGDCIAEMAKIEPGTIRQVVVDSPYNQGVKYDKHDERMSEAEFRDWCRRWMVGAARTLTPDGSLWALISHEWAADFEFLLRNEAGLTIVNWITWFESFGVNRAGGFNRCSRRLFHAVVDPRRYVFNRDAVTRPSDRQTKYGDRRADPGGKLWDDIWGINPPIPRLVDNARERLPDFPTQLPLALLLPIVGCGSEPGDRVLDPFSGSGTTGHACVLLGRRFLGIEVSRAYVERSRERLEGVAAATLATAVG